MRDEPIDAAEALTAERTARTAVEKERDDALAKVAALEEQINAGLATPADMREVLAHLASEGDRIKGSDRDLRAWAARVRDLAVRAFRRAHADRLVSAVQPRDDGQRDPDLFLNVSRWLSHAQADVADHLRPDCPLAFVQGFLPQEATATAAGSSSDQRSTR